MFVDRRVTPLRLAAAASAMAAVMLLVVALGEWVLLRSAWVRAVDEGGVARGTALLADTPWLHDAALAWSALSGPWFVHPAVLLVTLLLVARGRVSPHAVLVVAIGVLGWALGAVAKEIVDRPRPSEAVVEVGSWSYPSGHSTNIALGAVLMIALLTAVRTGWIRWGATALTLVAVALTAADRILLGVHFASDVAAGLLLGTGMALVGLLVLRPLAPDSPSPSASP